MSDSARFKPNWWCVDDSVSQADPIECIYNNPNYQVVKRTDPHEGHEGCGFRDAIGRIIPFNGDWYRLWQ